MSLDLDVLLGEAVARKASDLLVVPAAKPTLRVNGELHPLEEHREVSADDASDMLNPFLTPLDSAAFRRGDAVDFCFDRSGIGRFRCNLHRTRGGVAAALRLLPEAIPAFDSLNLPAEVGRFAAMHTGFVLIVGPTGAGKSTTLATLIDMINASRAAHIVTIENPVEYRHQHRKGVVEQIEIGVDAPSFADALRQSLRQDPDVILVGEMRDLETIAIALTAAETGHLVFSTMHTNDTSQAIDRIIDVFPAHQQNQIRQQLALSLSGVVAQHLVPVVDGGVRVPAVEILLSTDGVRNLIRTAKTHQLYSAIGTNKSSGMRTMEDSLAALVRAGRISRQAAFARSVHGAELESLLQ